MYRKSIIILIFLASSISFNNIKEIDNNDKYTRVYKLLYMNNYGMQIDEKGFWAAMDTYDSAFHKSPYIGKDSLLKYLKTIKKVKPYKGFDYHFAFIFKENDTVYASYDLKSWILKKNGDEIFYEGPNENTPKADTLYYKGIFIDPFFKQCW